MVNDSRSPNHASSNCPTALRRPKQSSSRYPVVTGGSTKGRQSSPSSKDLPRKSRRANNSPSARAGGKVSVALAKAISSDSRIASSSSGVKIMEDMAWLRQRPASGATPLALKTAAALSSKRKRWYLAAPGSAPLPKAQ